MNTLKDKNDIVVGIGEVLWDMLPEGKKVGGAPANFAYHVSQFGVPSMAISAIGHDELGEELLEHLNERGVAYHLDVVDYPTGRVHVSLDEDGVPQYEIRRHVAWDNIPYSEELHDLALRTRAVCFGSLAQRDEVSRATINTFLDSIPKDGDELIVFDINLRQDFFTKAILEQSMEKCNILKINDEELVIVGRMFELPGEDLSNKARLLLERYGLKAVILTCGVNGSYVFTHEGESFLPTPHVEVADTVGAGDSFTAAFIASLLRGKSIGDAHKKAVEVSAYVCTQAGAMPVLPAALTEQ